MSYFTTRVELYGEATFKDYEKLHAEMEKEEFVKTITKGEKTFHLPTAEYNEVGEFSKEEICERAKRAAKRCWIDFAVFVTKSEEARECYNLRPVK
jgi:hypothetical protein